MRGVSKKIRARLRAMMCEFDVDIRDCRLRVVAEGRRDHAEDIRHLHDLLLLHVRIGKPPSPRTAARPANAPADSPTQALFSTQFFNWFPSDSNPAVISRYWVLLAFDFVLSLLLLLAYCYSARLGRTCSRQSPDQYIPMV